jgi:hypothetical protein
MNGILVAFCSMNTISKILHLIFIIFTFTIDTPAEQRYHADSIMNFKNIMLDMHGVELFNDDAKDLIKQITDMENEIQDKSDDEAMSFDEEEYD